PAGRLQPPRRSSAPAGAHRASDVGPQLVEIREHAKAIALQPSDEPMHNPRSGSPAVRAKAGAGCYAEFMHSVRPSRPVPGLCSRVLLVALVGLTSLVAGAGVPDADAQEVSRRAWL